MDKGVTLTGEVAEMLKECGVKEVLFISHPLDSFFSPADAPEQKYQVKAVGADDTGNIIYWTHTWGKWESWTSDEMTPWEETGEKKVDDLLQEYIARFEEVMHMDDPESGIPI